MANRKRHNPDAAKARENTIKKAEAKKRAERNEYMKAHKTQLIAVCAAAVILIIGISQLADFLYSPDGCLKEYHGRIFGAGENALVYQNSDNERYYKAGAVTIPEGYHQDDSLQTSSDSKSRSYYLVADEPSIANSVYYAGVSKSSENMIATLESSGFYEATDKREFQVNGVSFSCIYGLSKDAAAEDGTEATTGSAVVACYANTSKGGSVLVMVQTESHQPTDQLPGADALYEQAEKFASYVTVVQ